MDQTRIAVHLKNTIMTKIIPTKPAEFCLGLIPRLTSDDVFALPKHVSQHLALAVGRIINKSTPGEA